MKKYPRKQEKVSCFGVVLSGEGAEKVNWKILSKDEIVVTLKDLNFPTPSEVGALLSSLSIRGDKKKNGDGYYYSTSKRFTGQLELGKNKQLPHYQIFFEMHPKLRKTKMLKGLSRLFFKKDNSLAISVEILREDTEAYEDYCKKEERANLPGKYSHMNINETLNFFITYSEENHQLKKMIENPYSYQKWIINLIKTEKVSRKIHWIVDMTGNSGKTTLKKYLHLNPEMNCLAVGLDNRRAFRHGLAKNLKRFKDTRGVEPSALIIDAPRDEEEHFLHDSYGILEDVNNGEIYSLFGNSDFNFTFRMGIPVVILTNTPPRIETLSSDRWSVKGLFRNVEGNDVYIQDAKVSTKITHWSSSGVVWKNYVETIPFNRKATFGPLNFLDNELFQMYIRNKNEMENLEEEEDLYVFKKHTLGIVSFWGPEETASLQQAPKYVKNEVFKNIHYARQNKNN